MPDNRYDLIVIGGGSGGLTAAIFAGRVGAKVLLVDRERLGGDCLHSGCVPSKALIASARAAWRMRHSAAFGIKSTTVEIDFAAVMQRVRDIQDEIARGESVEVLSNHGVEVAFGGAGFLDDRRILIGGEREVLADRVILATGSHAEAPKVEGLVEATFLNHVSLFRQTSLPKRLLVMGGGPIGCEMGQALSRLGAQVRIVERGPRLLPREEPFVSELLARALEEEGIEIELHSDVSKVTNSAAEKFVTLTGGDKERQVTCDQIRVAVGRAPSLEGLGLDRAGVQVHARGIRINDYLQTTKPHIFAVGDCNGGPQFTHWAEHEARIATRNVLFRGRSRRKLERIPWVTFTDPEVARVGLTYEEAQAKGLFPHIHELAMDHVDRAVCVGESRGKIRVVLDRREKILGVHIVAAGAGELLSEWVLAMDKGLRLGDIGKSIHVYPTLSRANRRVPDEAFFAHGLPAWIRRFLGKYRGR